MDRIVSMLKKPASFIIWVSLAAFGGFYLLSVIAGMADSDVGGILGGLLQIVVILGIVGGYVTAAILKKENVTKVLGVSMLSFYIVSELLQFQDIWFGSALGAVVVYNVFNLIALIALAAAVVVYLVGVFFDKGKVGKLLKIIALGGLGTYALLVLICTMVHFSYLDFWGDVMAAIAYLLVLPAVILGYLLLCMPDGPTEPMGEADPEPNEEAPQE